MTAGTRFWVVRPRVGASGVSGLGTLLSGAYIGLDPGQGERTHRVHGPRGAAADRLGRARAQVPAPRRGPGLGRPRLARLLPRAAASGRSWATRSTTNRRSRHARDLRRRAARRAGARHEPVLERERDRRLGRRRRRRGLDRVAADDHRRRDRVRHARDRGAGRGERARPRVPRSTRAGARSTSRSSRRKVPYLVHFDGSVRGLAGRRAGRVRRHPGGRGDGRPARVRRRHEEPRRSR